MSWGQMTSFSVIMSFTYFNFFIDYPKVLFKVLRMFVFMGMELYSCRCIVVNY